MSSESSICLPLLPISERLKCPISGELLSDPVVASDGYSYNRVFLQEWFANAAAQQRPPLSPKNGSVLASTVFYDNWTLRSIVEDLLKQMSETERKQIEEQRNHWLNDLHKIVAIREQAVKELITLEKQGGNGRKNCEEVSEKVKRQTTDQSSKGEDEQNKIVAVAASDEVKNKSSYQNGIDVSKQQTSSVSFSSMFNFSAPSATWNPSTQHFGAPFPSPSFPMTSTSGTGGGAGAAADKACSDSSRRFKVVLVGDGGVGKTAFVKRLRSGEFERKYIATLGVEVSPLPFSTNNGSVVCNCWDVAGQEKFGGLRDGYYCMADAAIFMFDVSNKRSYKSLASWYEQVKRVCPNIPAVVVGNKCDCAVAEKKIRLEQMTFVHQNKLQFYELSTKSFQHNNLEKPFLYLLQQLTQQPHACFTLLRQHDSNFGFPSENFS